MLMPTNSQCVNAGKLGYGCVALNDVEYGCLQGECPFFKTEDALKAEEHDAKARCVSLGYHFVSRDQVLDSIFAEKKRTEKRNHKFTKKVKVIRYCAKNFSFKEFDSIESAAKGSKLSPDKVKDMISKKEEYKSYSFFISED